MPTATRAYAAAVDHTDLRALSLDALDSPLEVHRNKIDESTQTFQTSEKAVSDLRVRAEHIYPEKRRGTKKALEAAWNELAAFSSSAGVPISSKLSSLHCLF